jgi:two-component system cell cycle response regulator
MSTILYLDDSEEFGGALESLFASFQLQLISVKDDQAVLERAQKDHPELIILDIDYLRENGFKVCSTLKNKRKTKNIPVLFLASEWKEGDVFKHCTAAGGDDCMIKPFSSRELVTRAHTIIKKSRLMRKLDNNGEDKIKIRNKLSLEIEKLQQANRGLEETAVIDKLTGLSNKSYFNTRLKEEFHRALRYETALSLMIIDIDHFGQLNDTFGHDVGDYILMKIANVLLMNSRIADFVGRLDGADFAVILPRTDAQVGVFEAERLRVAINQTTYIDDSLLDKRESHRRKKDEMNVTASFGVASIPSDFPVKNEMDFFALAKKALGRAKTAGKNKTVSATGLY